MKTKKTLLHKGLAAFPLCVLSAAISSSVLAQQAAPQENSADAQNDDDIEQVVVIGRMRSAAEELVVERLEANQVVDILGIEQITRVGDPNVADALRRVPGLTLVDNKFVYIRGLGERYSTATLNGAAVPSPDLTRNVIPLDIFPTAIVESLSVQKGYSANKGAAFGGGAIDIRTTSIPDSFVAYVGGSGGLNSLSDDYLDNPGSHNFGNEDGSRAIPGVVRDALNTTFINGGDFDISARALQQTADRNGNPITLAQAEALNSDLAAAFNRNLDITNRSSTIQDYGINGGIGDAFDLGGDFELGAMVTANFSESIRTQERVSRRLEEPDQEFTEQTKSTQNASLTVTAGAALKWGYEHTLETKNFFIRNTDDELFVSDEYNDTVRFGTGRGFRNFLGIFEERELKVNQFSGRHLLGEDTRKLLGMNSSFLDDLELSWFYSDSNATTNIPNSFTAVAQFERNTDTNEISDVNLALGGIVSNGLQLENLDLEDEMESWGFDLTLPVFAGDWKIEMTGGARTDRRARISNQLNFTIDGNSAINAQVTDSISERFSDANLANPDFDLQLALANTDFGPSLAATQIDGVYGQLDFDYNDVWTIVLGARYEDYNQVSAVFNPLALNSPVLPDLDPSTFTDGSLPPGIFQDDDFYPSASVKYTSDSFWAETFNVRLSWSETVVRPDLREIVDTSYRDPVTDFIITGNSSVRPSDIANYDVRAEWFFENGNNFTLSAFYKDIDNPIEIFAETATGNELRGEVLNADTAEVSGIEVEWLVNLEFLGDWGSLFFVQGNITNLIDNEIDAGLVEGNITNRQRELTQASDFVANIILGFDSDNGKHSGSLAFNTFSERLYISGEGGREDSFEQPFDSLDLTYTYFIEENFSVKFRARNILDDTNEITQEDDEGIDVVRFNQEVGQTYSISATYRF